MYTEHFFIYYSEGNYAEAKKLAGRAEECWVAVRTELGVAPIRRVRLYLAGTHAELEALIGGPEDFRLAGRARPTQSVIVLRLQDTAQQRRAVLAHELVHVALGQALEQHGVQPPEWLTEGLAEYVADVVTVGDQRRRPRGEAMPFSALHAAFPSDPQRSDLAYAQSRSFVEYLVKEMDDNGLRRLVRALGQTRDINEAFASAYGRSLAELEAEWRPRFATGLGRALPIDVDLAVFMGMGVLFVLACVVRLVRARRRRRAEEMEEDEYEDWSPEDDF